MEHTSPNNSENGSIDRTSQERKFGNIDMAEVQNYAFKKINISEMDKKTEYILWRKKIGAPVKSPGNELYTSKFPPVQNVPIELAPFKTKVRIATINQRRNEKKLNLEKMKFVKMGAHNRYKMELHRKL